MMFDRIILLSEGYMIFNGPPETAYLHFRQFGFKMLKFSNPADKVSIIAAEPRKLLSPKTSIYDLADVCRKRQINFIELNDTQTDEVLFLYNRRFSIVAESRETSSIRQFWLIFVRALLNQYREPLLPCALVLISVIQGLLFSSVFGAVGKNNYFNESAQER